jgi:hypothetical protein
VASRIADERGSILGDEVGYLIRFDNCCDANNTKILVRHNLPLQIFNPFSVSIVRFVYVNYKSISVIYRSLSLSLPLTLSMHLGECVCACRLHAVVLLVSMCK